MSEEGKGKQGFASMPKEQVQEIARKGGQASHSGGFASMDPDKQREIASKGGHAKGHASQESGHAHEFTEEERSRGGQIGGSRTKEDMQ